MKKILFTPIFLLLLYGCNTKFVIVNTTLEKKTGKDHPCYDSNLVYDGMCPLTCPGFEGCDGKFYCNECEAARCGIGPR